MATAPTTSNADPKQLVAMAIGSVSSIATLPEVTARIVKTVEDPRSNAQQLHQIVSHDPALVTRILKVVNSAFYGLPGQIASIERAIVMLGLNAIKNIAVAASLGQLFRGVKLCEGYTAKDLWTHCVGVAVVARELARQAKLSIADEAFLAGMIHDVGLLVSLQVWPEKLKRACEEVRKTGADFCETERTIIGVDHQQLGQALAEKWSFPRSCQLVTGFHHEPSLVAEGNKPLVSLVALADRICADAQHGFPLTRPHNEDGTEVSSLAEMAGVPVSVVDNVRTNIATILGNAASMLA
ncbi:MAG: HDOD domain-containing protein [Tepidisphaeraceae bacterium]